MWQIRWQIFPPTNGDFRFLFKNPYSYSSVADQVADLTPLEMAILDSYL